MTSKIAVLIAAALALAACSSTVAGTPHSSVLAGRPVGTAHSKHPAKKPVQHHHRHPRKPATHVHVSSFEGDGQTYGVGLPVILRFDKKVTDASALRKATTVTVNGKPAHGAWYFETSEAGYAMEGHYRADDPWPAHATIHVDAPLKDVSAGKGRAYDDDLTLTFRTGDVHVTTVYGSGAHPHMVVTSNGRTVRTLPVSLGSADHPTYAGTKVVEEFDRYENMGGTEVPWSVRVTNSGEFLHEAAWNSNIGDLNTSHGCTNLRVGDAEWFYHFSLIGDLVKYPDAPGPTQQVWDGIGDWNVSWGEWQQGGLA